MTMTSQFTARIHALRDIYRSGKAQIFWADDTFVVPSGVSNLRVTVHGAGGGGSTAGSGAGGGCAIKEISTSPAASFSVTVGSGGTGNGASSSFGAECSATGGGQGSGIGAAGGTGTGGDRNFTGGNGAAGVAGGGGGYGGGVGSSLAGGSFNGPALDGIPGSPGPDGTNYWGMNSTLSLDFSPNHILDVIYLTGSAFDSTGTHAQPGVGGRLISGAAQAGGMFGGGSPRGSGDQAPNGGIGAGGGGGSTGTSGTGRGGSGFVLVEW